MVPGTWYGIFLFIWGLGVHFGLCASASPRFGTSPNVSCFLAVFHSSRVNRGFLFLFCLVSWVRRRKRRHGKTIVQLAAKIGWTGLHHSDIRFPLCAREIPA